jgi:hypothetical protein
MVANAISAFGIKSNFAAGSGITKELSLRQFINGAM